MNQRQVLSKENNYYGNMTKIKKIVGKKLKFEQLN